MHGRSPRRRRRSAVWMLAVLSVSGGCLLYPQPSPPGDPPPLRAFVARSAPNAGRRVGVYERRVGRGEPQLVVLAFTGNAGLAQHQLEATSRLLGRWLTEDANAPRGAVVLAMQYPGYGEDHGAGTSMASIAAAAVDAVAWARATYPGLPLLVHGLSIGTTCALHVAERLPADVDGLLLEKPPNLYSMILWRYGWWNAWLIALPYVLSLPASACSEDLAAEITAVPALFVVGRRDTIAPPEYAREVFDAYRGEKRWLDADTGHGGDVTPIRAPGLVAALGWLWGRMDARR